MKVNKKLITMIMGVAFLTQICASNIYASEQMAEGQNNIYNSGLSIDELEQYYNDIDAEEVKFANNSEVSNFIIEDKENMIDSYELMQEEEKNIDIVSEIRKKIKALKNDVLSYKFNNCTTTFASSGVPSSVDITTDSSTSKFFPAIVSQGKKPSCQFFSMYYYMYSYEANKLNNVSSKEIGNCYSPEWGYVQYYNARNGIYDSLKNFGAVKWSDFPYTESETKKLSDVTEDALLRALRTRLETHRTIAIPFSNYPIVNGQHATLDEMKQILCAKKPIYGFCCTDWLEMKTSSGEVIITRVGASQYTHALTIVGYDDNIWCDVNGNKVKDPGETGAFKVANSWGTAYGNDGYYWVLYDALNGQSQIKGFDEAKYTSTRRYPAFINYFEVFNLKAYRPIIVAKLDYESWNPNKTKTSWGVSSVENKKDENIDLTNPSTIPLNVVRLYDYADEVDTLSEVVGNRTFSFKMANRIAGDTSKYFNRIRYSLIDNKKTVIQNNSGTITSNGTVKLNTALKLGDVNYDKKVTNADSQFVLNVALKIENNASDLKLLLADYNKDGKVDMKDVSAINQNRE